MALVNIPGATDYYRQWRDHEETLGRAKVPDPGFDVSEAYKNILGRAPDPIELSSDTENLGKYGSEQLLANLRQRASSNGQPAPRAPTQDQFSDPYSNQLEGIAKAQMGEVRSNPGLDQLLKFLNAQFSDLATNPGYNTQELALLNTQALEPIEQRRGEAQRRVLERTAARGFLPSSGLTEDMAQNVDIAANRERTSAGRDLAIHAIGQRDADLNRALQLGSLIGLDIPRSQRGEELNLANLLYQMPRTALQDLLAVLNGSPTSSDLFGQAQGTQQQSLLAQQQADARNAALWEQIGLAVRSLF